LLNFLNAQYAGGTNAGKYVFLRLNKDAGNGTNVGRYNITAADGAAVANAGLPDLTIWPRISYVAAPSGLVTWRQFYFGTMENAGVAADGYDANGDGEANLIEFATCQNPLASTRAATSVALNATVLEFRYQRSAAASGDGILFSVEWSDTLLPGSWSAGGVVDREDPANPGTEILRNRIATVPLGTAGRRFVQLRATTP
jgi:hypothetical protein